MWRNGWPRKWGGVAGSGHQRWLGVAKFAGSGKKKDWRLVICTGILLI